MRGLIKKHGLILLEVALFAVTIGVLAIDEFAGIPIVFAGIRWQEYKTAEFLIEATLVSIVCVVSVLVTLVLQRRLRNAESFLRVCGWCKKVSNEGKWIPFEEYVSSKYGELPTHGICEGCKARMLEEARRKHDELPAPR